MAATNVQARRVYGPVAIQVTTASNATLETLGVSQAGANLAFIQHRRPVYDDIGGPETPVDFQDFGETCRITFTLQSWTEDVLRRLRSLARTRLSSKAAVHGDIAPRGRLLGGATNTGGAFSLFIPPSSQSSSSALWEDSWFFPVCDLDQSPEEQTVGSVVTAVRISVFAFPYIPATLTSLPNLTGDNAFGKLYMRGTNTTAPTAVFVT